MHPSFEPISGYVEYDVRRGDALMHRIYDAVRTSPARDRTLLMMVFGEHGGMHDHCVPPAATPPGGEPDRTYGFGFDRLGVRTPAIAISSQVAEGTIVNDQMQNTSVIATLEKKWGIESLTPRDASAPTFEGVFNSESVRDWPEITPPKDPAPQGSTNEFANPLAKATFGSAEVAAASLEGIRSGNSPSPEESEEPSMPARLGGAP